jgi:hypothetical protein
LVDAQVVIDRATLAELQTKLDNHVSEVELKEGDGAVVEPGVLDIPRFLSSFLEWPVDQLVGWDGARPVPDELKVALPEFGETLSPTYALAAPTPSVGASPWMLLVQCHSAATDLDKPTAAGERGWLASPAKKFERLLRETQIPIGLISNGVSFRLVYAPPKENSGALTFRVGAMTEVSGRLILGAFHLLLNEWTLFSAPSAQRLPSLLQRSRDYQASVSEKLAEQVLHALYELLRGLEAADAQANGNLLRELAAVRPHDIYGGLVTVLLRLVFVLFAEDRGLLPMSGLYVRHYSVRGLFERLRADAEKYPDTMDLRYGSWAQLLALFRLIHGGCEHPELKMPAREGHLFDPNRHSFLEGRAGREDPIAALPLVSDGVLYRILDKLCVLDGERVSYRTLDVEEIGSVYQTIMGFDVQIAAGTAVGLKGKRKNGGVPASPVIYLEALLEVPLKDRGKWLKEMADTELTGEAEKKLKSSISIDDLLDALGKRIDPNATPSPVPKGGLILQPTDERRRSGSHYTPRSFTEPIVRRTLEPILKRFGDQPSPEQILSLKVCDIAVGSAAFLVEACRQLADVLVRAWRLHGGRPILPPDETEELLAMRTIAPHCLYGVDRNPMAVDLAKLSVWLATLAKDHPFTFLDHAIRCGDSLVGLTKRQIEGFAWRHEFQTLTFLREVDSRVKSALSERKYLLNLGDDFGTPEIKREKLRKADELLDLVRFIGDAAVAAFFSAAKNKARETKRGELAERIAGALSGGNPKAYPTDEVKALRCGRFPVMPFHWEIEFPEVFDRENPGFDCIVGNPPFLGGKRISTANGDSYRDWLQVLHVDGSANSDLVGQFFRRGFNLIRSAGAFGLIATNTIAQGDTRYTGLRWICNNGGTIFAARRRHRWPGQAAVVVSVCWIIKARVDGPFLLDEKPVALITAYLFSSGGHESPAVLAANGNLSFVGNYVLGMGFTFDDTDTKGVANSISDMRALIERNAANSERISPFIGGEEINDSPSHAAHRFVINFGDLSEDEARQWPDLMAIVEAKVRPERLKVKRAALRQRWWQFAEKQPALLRALNGKAQTLVCGQTSKYLSFAYLPTGQVFSHKVIVFPAPERSWHQFFAVMQSRSHQEWADFMGSSMKDDPVYTPSDCFETFPFPEGFEANTALEVAGLEYYEFRAALMQDLWLGLTEIYNLFHSPDNETLARLESLYRKRATMSDWRDVEGVSTNVSPLAIYTTPAAAHAGVRRLRTLHDTMDAAVLSAYGWSDLLPKCVCEFLFDYEEEEPESGAEESPGRKKKKPWRYRWPDETRDEVLARLLKLNAKQAKDERLAGAATTLGEQESPLAATKPGRKKRNAGISPRQPELLPPSQGDLFA